MSEQRAFGLIEMVGKDIAVPGQRFDKIALSGRRELLLLSVIGETHNIKRMRAILVGGAKAQIQAAGVRVRRKSDPSWEPGTQPGRLSSSSGGYHVYTNKLGFGLTHALFLSRTDGFMKVTSGDALWLQLKSPRFSTPLLKEWIPYIEQKLRAEYLLEDAHCFGCECAMLSAVTKQLDQIVSEGLKSHNLLIESTPQPVAQSA